MMAFHNCKTHTHIHMYQSKEKDVSGFGCMGSKYMKFNESEEHMPCIFLLPTSEAYCGVHLCCW